jgi:hypothetical protein
MRPLRWPAIGHAGMKVVYIGYGNDDGVDDLGVLRGWADAVWACVPRDGDLDPRAETRRRPAERRKKPGRGASTRDSVRHAYDVGRGAQEAFETDSLRISEACDPRHTANAETPPPVRAAFHPAFISRFHNSGQL